MEYPKTVRPNIYIYTYIYILLTQQEVDLPFHLKQLNLEKI